jgi:von Willebrand factor type A domain-containing protein
MKRLSPLIVGCLLAVSYGQQTASVPIIVAAAESSSPSLQASDLKVEVNHQPATIVSLTSFAGEHLWYVLINDRRVITKWRGGTEQQVNVAAKFLKQVITAGADIGTLVNSGDSVLLDVQNEKDPAKLASKLDLTGLYSPLYDAIVASTQLLMKQPTSADYRKVIFLFCDGTDNKSHVHLDDAIRALQKASVPIFIFAPSEVERRKNGEQLRKLADQAGGRTYFLPPDTRHLAFDDLKRDLAQSFLLTVSVPQSKGMSPLIVTDLGNPKASVIGASQVFVP